MTDIIEKLRVAQNTVSEARNEIFQERKKSAEMLNMLVAVNTTFAGLDEDALADNGLTDIADRIAVFLKRKAQS